MNDLPRRSKHSLIIVPKRIDDRTEFYPPVDYSFSELKTIDDAFKLRPRRALGSTKENDRYYSYGMNLNHNLLKDSLENFPKFIQTILVNPDTLSMIDLSFNQFTEIPSVLTQISSLKYFYFHKNHLETLTDLSKLRSLHHLKYLTLHGNPIEITVPYLRPYMLFLLPGLRSLNFTPVSQADLNTSVAWRDLNQHKISQ